ncbi:ABC transporter ATP-binding protein [Roseateles oligotrophus]|uniref:ABC transporter ATP-binding protein n=1 Tax=Roseateles oligotrophus TaxID=1769250 RepID=A0ABT2YK08_9BURK|nr:ABC transporter ATP-binding protein [Roseateles oligotrophus]MCV2370401.1 ABC transporter ATP-binding protein [Roseateles oligotrophus]
MSSADVILEVRGLSTSFATPAGVVKAVNDLSFSLHRGETLAIVGESGCGKSVTSFSLMRLLASQASITGEAWLSGRDGKKLDLLALSGTEMESVRGKQLGMIFQEPMTSLNPLHRLGDQIGESMIKHGLCSVAEASGRAIDLLKLVGISAPELRARQYPHQISGGMRQRVMIAIALACKPQVLIADEPTTALDVTIQAQILRLIRRLQREVGMGVLFITHDMAVVAQVADRVAVMYGGQLVETADTRSLFKSPRHPYTRGLLASVPNPKLPGRLYGIPGQVETVYGDHIGCRFANRCSMAQDICRSERPGLSQFPQAQFVRCHFADFADFADQMVDPK